MKDSFYKMAITNAIKRNQSKEADELRKCAKREIPKILIEKDGIYARDESYFTNPLYYKTKCVECHKTFLYKHKNGKEPPKFCSTNCRHKHNRKKVIKKCIVCGKEYITDSCDEKYAQFCSEKCYQEGLKKAKINGTPILTCVNCGKEYPLYTNTSGFYDSYQCECEMEIKRNQKVHTCYYCGKKYYTSSKKSKFCSLRCSSKQMRKDVIWKNLNKNKKEYEKIAQRKLPLNNEDDFEWIERNGIYGKSEEDFDYLSYNPNALKTCKQCGRKYISSNNEDGYCSRKCFYESKKSYIVKKCLNCNKEYSVSTTDEPYSQFCSDECEQDYYKHIKEKCKVYDRLHKCTCINCGKVFYDITNTSVEFCSYQCSVDFNHKQKLITKKCKQCGKEFQTYNNSDFCSTSCSSKYHIEHGKRPPKQHHAWNKGLTSENCKIIKHNTKKQSFSMKKGIASGRIKMYFKGKHLTKEHKKHCAMGVAKAIREGRKPALSRYISGFFKDIGHYVRSGWEYNFAKILIHLNRNYEYEPRTFLIDCGKQTYTPDFYDKDRNLYYEVKGWFPKDEQEKFKKFREQYPDIKIHLLQTNKFKKIYFSFKDKIKMLALFNVKTTKIGILKRKDLQRI